MNRFGLISKTRVHSGRLLKSRSVLSCFRSAVGCSKC
jgi:hypothetical protein